MPAPAGRSREHGRPPDHRLGAALAVVFLEASSAPADWRASSSGTRCRSGCRRRRSIYLLGGLDERFFLRDPRPELSAARAGPPGLRVSPSWASADAVTVHLLFWFPLVAFVAAVAGLLAPRVPALLLWPVLLLGVLTPEVVDARPGSAGGPAARLLRRARRPARRALAARAAGVAARGRGSAAVRGDADEARGVPARACVGAAALIASWRERAGPGRASPSPGSSRSCPTLFWRVWFTSHDVAGEAPEAGGLGLLDHLDRAWPSFRLTLSALFDADLWLLAAPLGVLAVAWRSSPAPAGCRSTVGLLGFFMVAGFSWVTWSFPSLPITKDGALNPIVRLTGSLVLTLSALVPLLLAPPGADGRPRTRRDGPRGCCTVASPRGSVVLAAAPVPTLRARRRRAELPLGPGLRA